MYFNKKMWTMGISLFCAGNMAVSVCAQPQGAYDSVQTEGEASMDMAVEEGLSDATPSDEKAVPRGCANAEQLRQRLSENNGETITLTGDIIWNEQEPQWIAVTEDTTVDMNGYSLVIADGASIMLTGPIHFTGMSTKEKPLIVLGENSSFNGYAGVTVSAEGLGCIGVASQGHPDFVADAIHVNGEDSVAVLLKENQEEIHNISIRGEITASGKGAAALEGTGHIYLYQNNLSVSGENSVAVRTDGNVYALFSQIQGQGGIVDTPGEVVFDGCEVSPMQENAVIITRKATPEPIHITAMIDGDYSLPEYISFQFGVEELDYNGFFAQEVAIVQYVSLPVQWDASPVDTQKAGNYTVTAIPMEFQQVSTIDFQPITGQVQMIDKIPEIRNAFYIFDSLVLKLDTQIYSGLPFAVSYRMGESDQWTVYQDAVLDENKNAIVLNHFGAMAGEEEQEITFRIGFTIQSQEKVTADFPFTGKPPQQDGGGDRDGGDQKDQGSSQMPLPPKEEVQKDGNENSDFAKNLIRDWMQPMGRIWQQIGQRPSAPTMVNTNPLLQKTEEAFKPEIAENVKNDIFPVEEAPTNPHQLPETTEHNETSAQNGANEKQTNNMATALPNRVTALPNGNNDTLSEHTVALLTGGEVSYLVQANPQYLTFPSEDIRLLIPTEALKDLSLSASQQLRVELNREGEGFFTKIWIDDRELIDWTANPLQVYLSAEKGENHYCYVDDEKPIQGEVMENGEIMFQLPATGEYTIERVGAHTQPQEEPTKDIQQTSQGEQMPPVSHQIPKAAYGIAAVLLMIGITVFISWRKKG